MTDPKELKTLDKVKDYIRKNVGVEDYEDVGSTINKHFNELILKDHFSVGEIGECLIYCCEHLDQKITKQYGLYFLRTYRKESRAYWNNLKLEQAKQREIAAEMARKSQDAIIFNYVPKPKKRKPRQIDIDEIIRKGEN